MRRTIKLEEKVRAKGWEIAGQLREMFRRRGIFVINLIGSPGSGKTSLLERLAGDLKGRAAVIEGDLQTDEDKRRIERAGLRACQINTSTACHLDACMIRDAVDKFSLDDVRFLFIENVGNLVCPASFDIGEDVKVAVISVTEGDDKPAKYPTAIHAAAGLVITKTDLLPYIDCDIERIRRDAINLRPGIGVFTTSAKTGDGVRDFLLWIESQAEAGAAVGPA